LGHADPAVAASGCYVNGDRQIGFFSAGELRSMLLEYEVPEYMPGALPIAFDGGGTFYLFDMRKAPSNGEYPILFADAGALEFEEARVVGSSFLEVCQGTTDPYDEE
jgi:hypothetical protein